MDNRPIGIFDSGLGGLTCVKKVMELMPGEDIIYFGDTGRVPYGSRSSDTILKYTRQDIRFLQTFDIKFIIIACGKTYRSLFFIRIFIHRSNVVIFQIIVPANEEIIIIRHRNHCILHGIGVRTNDLIACG